MENVNITSQVAFEAPPLRLIGGTISASMWAQLEAEVLQSIRVAIASMETPPHILTQEDIDRMLAAFDALIQTTALKTWASEPRRRYETTDYRSTFPDDVRRMVETFVAPTWPQVLALHPDANEMLKDVFTTRGAQFASLNPVIVENVPVLDITAYHPRAAHIPDDIGLLKSLHELKITVFDTPDSIPFSITKLTNLKSLYLFISSSYSTTFRNMSAPDNMMFHFPLLEELHITDTNVPGVNLEPDPRYNPRLRKLELDNRDSLALPFVFPQLETLSLHATGGPGVPPSIYATTTLTSLSLSDRTMVSVPDAIAMLTSLTELDLKGNPLSEVPRGILQLTSLVSLNITGTNITDFSSLGSLVNLTELELGFGEHDVYYAPNTKTFTLPDEVARLPLEYLSIYGASRMTAISPLFAHMPTLKHVTFVASSPASDELLSSVFPAEMLHESVYD